MAFCSILQASVGLIETKMATQCLYYASFLGYIKCKNIQGDKLSDKDCPKIYLYEIWYCPKICHAENFLTDMRMSSVNSITKTRTETRNLKVNLNHGMKDYRKHAKF